MNKKIESLKVSGETVPVKENNKFSLNINDGLKALLIAILAPVVDFLIQAVQDNGFKELDWYRVLSIGLSAGLVYLAKNFLSPSTVIIAKKDL